MSRRPFPINEFDIEMTKTRRLLERVPSEHAEWKPHEKSFALGHLAQLVAWMPGWIAQSLREDVLDLTEQPGYSFETTEALLDIFDDNVAAGRAAMAEVTDGALDQTWTLRMGDQEIYSARRDFVVRDHLRHLVHHRGQLTVYLRLLDVPIPPIYGPTADEGWSR